MERVGDKTRNMHDAHNNQLQKFFSKEIKIDPLLTSSPQVRNVHFFLCSQKDSLEHTLQATKARYSSQLAEKQAMLNTLEAQVMQIRTDTENQNRKYNDLLGIKTRLEQEIATYRRLLEGEDIT